MVRNGDDEMGMKLVRVFAVLRYKVVWIGEDIENEKQ